MAKTALCKQAMLTRCQKSVLGSASGVANVVVDRLTGNATLRSWTSKATGITETRSSAVAEK